MNLDELQSVQARERQSSDLQHLRSSFYREVGEYIDELTDRRSALVAEAEDPFSSPEVRQLSDDIETAEQTVEAIYERRVGKVVKKASIAAAGMPVDDDGLTEEEEALFEALVDRIERNRETVLSVLDGEAPAVPDHGESGAGSGDDRRDVDRDGDDGAPVEEPGVRPEGVDAADLMGGGGDEADPEKGTAPEPPTSEDPGEPDPGAPRSEVPPDPAPPGDPAGDRPDDDRPESDAGDIAGDEGQFEDEAGRLDDEGAAADPDRDREGSRDAEPASGSSGATTGDEEARAGSGDVPGVPRTTVRITADVGEVVGADNRDYDLGPEDVVTLPEANADVLVEKDAAERLE